MPRRGVRGLTLMELLTVLAIMVILAGLAYPIYFSAINYSHRSSCASNLQQIAMTVELYRQDGNGYPGMPGYMGQEGMPNGGVSGLMRANKNKNGEYLWCIDDSYPRAFPDDMRSTPAAQKANGLQRDFSSSTYDYGYNYYGYVTATDGLPFPVTTGEAARYFFGDPYTVDSGFPSGDPNWNLGLIDPATFSGQSQRDVRPRGLFQGLLNTWAPQNTIVTFCPHHYTAGEGKGTLIAVTLNGTAQYLTPVSPMLAPNVRMALSGAFTRKDIPGGATAPIDWRVNKMSFINDLQANSKLFGDAPRNLQAQNMPVVQVVTRRFRDADLPVTNPWFDTGIPLQPHDFVMVSARARWQPSSIDSSDAAYASLANAVSQIWFTAEGDPVEAPSTDALPNLLLPRPANSSTTAQKRITHGLLIGRVGAGGEIFPLGSRGSYLVTGSGSPDTLRLSMNEDNGAVGAGWCEVWIAVFRP